MNREEIEKLIEESTRKKRTGRNKFSSDTVRKVLNIIFLACAVVGLVLYFALPENHLTGMSVIAVGMCFKIAEFFLRFLF